MKDYMYKITNDDKLPYESSYTLNTLNTWCSLAPDVLETQHKNLVNLILD